MVKISELREKEMINIRNGSRLGFIDDIEMDLDKGEVVSVTVSGHGKVLGIFGKNNDLNIRWGNIVKIGIDIILVDLEIED